MNSINKILFLKTTMVASSSSSSASSTSLYQTALLSGVIAAIVAALSTRAIEKFGSKIGGILTTLPTTIIPASIGLCYATGVCSSSNNNNNDSSSSSSDYPKLVSAMFMTSCGMLVNALYLLQWKIDWPAKLDKMPIISNFVSFSKSSKMTKLAVMFLVSFGVWLKSSLIVFYFVDKVLGNTEARTMIFGMLCFVALTSIGIYSSVVANHQQQQDTIDNETREEKLKDHQSKNNHDENTNNNNNDSDIKPATVVSWSTLFFRGLAAGIANAVCVLLSSVSGIISGLAATFPAIFTTIMVSLYLSSSSSDDGKDDDDTTTTSNNQSANNREAEAGQDDDDADELFEKDEDETLKSSRNKTSQQKTKKNLSSSSVGPIILGSISVPIYSMAFALLIPTVSNPYVTAIISWIIAVGLGSYPASKLLEGVKK